MNLMQQVRPHRWVLGVLLMAGGWVDTFAQYQGTVTEQQHERAVRAEAAAQMRDIRQRSQNVKRSNHGTRNAESGPLFKSEGQLTGAERKIFEPSPTLRTRYADFLRQPETGLVKLLAVKSSKTVSAVPDTTQQQLPLLGGGIYYSFAKRNHEASPWADLRLRDNKLQTAFTGHCLGLLTLLGDVPLENVRLQSPGISFLAAFQAPLEYAEAEQYFEFLQRGAEADGFIYKNEMPVLLNTVYVLRSINYKRADHLIVFRLVSQESDGSVTILWKRLQTFPALALKNVPRGKSQPSELDSNKLISVSR